MRCEQTAAHAHLEDSRQVVHDEGSRQPRQNIVEDLRALGRLAIVLHETRAALLECQAVDTRGERDRQEEQVVARVETVPERRDKVRGKQRATRAVVHTLLQPLLSALVPRARAGAHALGSLEAEPVDVGRRTPRLGLGAVAEPGHDGGALRQKPAKVVLAPHEKQGQPHCADVLQPANRASVRRRSEPLLVEGKGHGELGTAHNHQRHHNHRLKEHPQSRGEARRHLLTLLELGTVAHLQVLLDAKRGTGKV